LVRIHVPSSLGLLLLTDAALKGWELYAAPLLEASMWSSRAFRIAALEAEGFLGLWLLSDLGARVVRWAVGAFHVFFTLSLSRALAGEECCSCFGPVPIDPRWTAALDLAAFVVSLSKAGASM
jgi:hypothetical protein